MAFDRLTFWQDPAKSVFGSVLVNCRPEFYLDLHNISAMVVDVMKRYADPSWSILEIGCGTGRNLVALKDAGFENVSGIELSEYAIAVGLDRFPEYAEIEVINEPVEDVIKELEPVDVIFTSGLLMHLPRDLDWVLEEISGKARRLLMTNEGELSRGDSVHAWSRDYKATFEGYGWEQVEVETGEKYPPLPSTTLKRVFTKEYVPEPEPEPEPPVVEVEEEPPVKSAPKAKRRKASSRKRSK